MSTICVQLYKAYHTMTTLNAADNLAHPKLNYRQLQTANFRELYSCGALSL